MSKERYVYIDIAKAFGIILVVFNHCHIGDTVNFYYAIGRLGVPLLLFSSGYVLFDREILGLKDIFIFYKKHLYKFFVCNCIWVLIWNFFNLFYFKLGINLKNLLLEMLALRQTAHMWNSWFQMPMIGYYIMLPIIKFFMNKTNKLAVYILLFLSIIYFYVLPTAGINYIAGIKLRHAFIYLAPYFLLYPLIGYLCKIKMSNVIYLIVILAYYIQNKINNFQVSYDDFFIVFTSFICFRYICNIEKCKFQNLFTFISKRTLPIFYIHMPLRHILGSYIKYLPFSNAHVQTIILVFIDVLICFFIIAVLDKIPSKSIKKYLLFN